MDKKVLKFVLGGFAIYGIFAASVLTFYEDDPDQMNWEDRQAYNKRYINQLSIENNVDTKTVIAALGSPDITEAKRLDTVNYQVMFYRTQHEKSDGMTTKDECTALLFKDGVLISWGESAYNKYSEL